jgi:hypothetical protein
VECARLRLSAPRLRLIIGGWLPVAPSRAPP